MINEIDNDLSTDGLDLEALGLSEESAPEKYLTSPETIAAYLTEILEDDDFGQFNEALNTIARSEGAPKIAALAGMSREGLYKALRKDSKPRFETVMGVLDALGMKVTVQSKPDANLAANYKTAYGKLCYGVTGAVLAEYSGVKGHCVPAIVRSMLDHHLPGEVAVEVGKRHSVVPPVFHVLKGGLPSHKGRRKSDKKLGSYRGLTASEPEVVQPFFYEPAH